MQSRAVCGASSPIFFLLPTLGPTRIETGLARGAWREVILPKHFA